MKSSCCYESKIMSTVFECLLIPIITVEPTNMDRNTLDNILLSHLYRINLLQVDSGANFGDHYRILFEFILTDQPQLLGSKPQLCYSYNSIHSLAKFRDYWLLFSF